MLDPTASALPALVREPSSIVTDGPPLLPIPSRQAGLPPSAAHGPRTQVAVSGSARPGYPAALVARHTSTRQVRTFWCPVGTHNHASSRAIGVGTAGLIVGPQL